MDNTGENYAEVPNGPSTWGINWYGTQEKYEAMIARALSDLPKIVAWNHGVTVRQVLLREVSDGWQALIKGDHRGKPVVSFTWGASYTEALEMTAFLIDRDALEWKPDKYPPKKK